MIDDVCIAMIQKRISKATSIVCWLSIFVKQKPRAEAFSVKAIAIYTNHRRTFGRKSNVLDFVPPAQTIACLIGAGAKQTFWDPFPFSSWAITSRMNAATRATLRFDLWHAYDCDLIICTSPISVQTFMFWVGLVNQSWCKPLSGNQVHPAQLILSVGSWWNSRGSLWCFVGG